MILSFNQLRGPVLSELGDKLTRLWLLDLQNNSLTGAIPESLGNLSWMSYMFLSYNQLKGTIPPSLGGFLGLKYLDLSFNRLSGELPVSLYNLSSLESFQIEANMIYGSIPDNIDIGSRFPRMRFLSFGANQLTGLIPASISNLTSLQDLDLSQNRLSRYVPRELGRLQAMRLLSLQVNMLEADNRDGWEFITSLSNCSQLVTLQISGNAGLAGQLPSSIANLSTSLRVLRLDDLGISGTIPSAIGNLVGLQLLTVANNSVSGVIPESIGKLANLVMLGLYNTDLSGSIPSSIGNMSKLIKLFAYNGNLEGGIPASIENLKNLLDLALQRNRLNGSIPTYIFELPALFYLDLSYNSLLGPLPSEVGSLKNINFLYLSGNQLSGKIPESIIECTVLQELRLHSNSFEGSVPQSLSSIKGLSVLDLSMNKLSHKIPNDFGSIHVLEELRLAHNNLSGSIPTVLQNLTSLIILDLSFNNLQGEVPKEGIFRMLTNFSIAGNNELCGGVSQLHLVPCHTNSVKKNKTGKMKFLTIALATSGTLLFVAFVVVLVQLVHKKKLRRRQKSPSLPPIIKEWHEKVSYRALANGTNGFSEANFLGKGTFGAVYKCTFQGDGTIAAVKVFNLEQSGSIRSFVDECEALRRVHHRCLIKIITCCSSINHQGQEFKALVFEFMPNGDLHGWLHLKSDMPTPRNTLSLLQRLDIAVGIIDALDYLHNHCQPPIVHCDLKPSNILLADDMSARVADFGISRILPETSKTLQNLNSLTGIRGSIGYVAPEYGEGSAVSTISDVYSLGIMLLEMFTGRSPTDEMFGDAMDLHTYVEHALSERILDIVDSTIWLHVESRDSIVRSRIKDCLVSVFRLSISCSKQHPRDRMTMRDAAVEMHTIRDSYHMFSC